MGEGAGPRSAELTLPAKATSPARARRFVSGTLSAWDVDGGDDALLIVSELVTNALLHARTKMTVTLTEHAPGLVRLEVTDGSGEDLHQRNFSLDSGTGRGLRLLDALAAEWGVERHAGGKTVWCVVSLTDESFTAFDVDAVEAL